MDARNPHSSLRRQFDWIAFPSGRGRSTESVLVRVASSVIMSLLAALALWICWRRANGVSLRPLGTAGLCGISASLALAAAAFRRIWKPTSGSDQSGSGNPGRWFVIAAPTLVALAWAVALSISSTPLPDLIALWGTAALITLWPLRRRADSPAEPLVGIERSPGNAAPPADSASEIAPLTLAVEPLEETPADATQQYVRRGARGEESIEGWLRVDIQPGQRHAYAHLAICPPLSLLPHCAAEPIAGPDAEVKVAQVLTHGVRFEIKLDETPAEATTLMMEFAICEQPFDSADE